MKSIRITANEVAKKAGVSQSTVSRVFNPKATVSTKTIDKVNEVAQKLGYRPNVLARSLITGKTKIIGFIVSYLDNQFYSESLQKLSEKLQDKGYHMLIFTIDNKPEKIAKMVQELLDYQVDAIIAASVSIDNQLATMCAEIGVPIVLYNRSQNNDDVSFVTSDNIAGGKTIAHHFAKIGVKRPSYIAGWQGASTQRDREIGYLQGLAERGLSLFAYAKGDFSFTQARIATQEIFSTSEKPDGIFVASDHMAFAVMDYLRFELGLQIPQDVVVSGYDNVPIASWASYNLTTIHQSTETMVAETVNAILQLINNSDHKPIRKTIDTPLIIRQSTRR